MALMKHHLVHKVWGENWYHSVIFLDLLFILFKNGYVVSLQRNYYERFISHAEIVNSEIINPVI